MPRFDGTGPFGFGPGTGRGLGPCGAGMAWRRGWGKGFGRWVGWKRFGNYPFVSGEEEKEWLEEELKDLEEEAKEIRVRLAELKDKK